MMKHLLLTLLIVIGLSTVTNADTWSLPTPEKYCSENKKYCLKVEPKKLDSQLSYFQDKVDSKDDAGSDKKVKENYCKGVFFNKRKKLWNIRLDNEVSPVSAIVSNDGDYVVTFDNWHGTGYGDNVVVIYNASNGNLIKKLGLTDFLTESDVAGLTHSVSSIWWSGVHMFDYEKKQLILTVLGGLKVSFDVHIDLITGKILDEKTDRIPSLQFLIVTNDNDDKYADQKSNLEISGCQTTKDATNISRQELLKRVVSQELPKYPPAAKAVRAVGGLLVNVLVSEMGEVECLEVKFGHPLLRAATINSLKKWKFEKATTKYVGQLVFEGKFALMLNGKTVE
jgi:Gram-negative bacterial TonB protein C-terminal